MAKVPRRTTEFEAGYVDCLLWLASGQETEDGEMDAIDDAEADEITARDWRDILRDAKAFERDNRAMLDTANAEGRSDEYLGQDFCLSRSGHGTGFWDRGLSVGDALHDAAKVYGPSCLVRYGKRMTLIDG